LIDKIILFDNINRVLIL